MARRSLGRGGSILHPRSSILVFAAFLFLALSPAAHAIIWNDSSARASMWADEMPVFDFATYPSYASMADVGPDWFRNALSGSSARTRYIQFFVFDSAGDRLAPENGYVGTLSNVFDVGLFNNISPFVGGGSGKTSSSFVSAATGATLDWNGGTSTAWTLGSNWDGGAAPTDSLTINIARFNKTTYANQPSTGGIRSISGIINGDGIVNTAALTITNTSNTLNIGGDGITIFANAGSTTINAGTLNIGANQNWANNSSNLLTISTTNLRNSNTTTPFTLTINGSGSGGTSISSIIADSTSGTGTFALNINTTGGLTTLSGVNTFTGGLTLTQGVLRATTSANSLGQGTLTLAGGELQLGGGSGLSFNRNTTVSGDTQITSDRSPSGSGVTYTFGTLSIGTNQLSVTSGAADTSGIGGITFGSTTFTGNSAFNVTNGATATTTLTLGALNDGGSTRIITKSGNGTLTLGTAATNLVDGTEIKITGGVLSSTNATALGSLADVIISTGATFSLGASQTIGALDSATSNTGSVALGSNTLTIGSTNNLTSGFAGVISGTGNIIKLGTGTLVLSGANNYTGTTTIGASNGANAGTLQLSGSGLISTAATTLFGGTLDLNGTTQTITTLAIGGGASGGAATVSIGTGELKLGGNVTYDATNNPNGATISSTTGKLSLLANRTFTVGDSSAAIADLTISAIIQNGDGSARSLTKTGAGTLVLSGVNTYTGGTNINGGVLNLGVAQGGGGGPLGGTGAVDTTIGTISFGGGTLQYSSSNTTDYSGRFSQGANQAYSIDTNGQTVIWNTARTPTSGTLTKTGAGTLDITTTSNGWTGATTIDGGTLKVLGLADINTNSSIGKGSSAGSAADLVFGGGTLQYTGSTATSTNRLFTIGDANGNTAILDASGTGSGTLSFTGSGSVAFGNTSAHTLTLTGSNTGANTFTPIIGDNVGATSLTKTGSGTWVLSGANTYGGDTTITLGTLRLGAADRIPDGSGKGNVTVTGTLDLNTFSETTNGLSGAGTVDTVAGGAPTLTVGNNDQTSSFGGVIKNTAGTLTLTKTGSGTLTLTNQNTYTGGTNVNGGTLSLGHATNTLADAGAVTVGGGILNIGANSDTVGAVTLTSGSIIGTTGTLTGSSYDVRSGSISAKLGGSSALTKSTAGTVTLSGTNSYSGLTTISQGILQVDVDSALGTTASGTTVSNGGALKLNGVSYSTAEGLTLNGSGISGGGALTNTGTSSFAGAITLQTSSTISAGGGTLTLSGGISKGGVTLTIAGGGTVNITTNGITGSSANSDLIVDGSTLVLSVANSYNGPTTVQNTGTLRLGNNNVLPTSPQTALTINTNSFFDLASFSDSILSLSGDNTGTVKNSVAGGTSTLTVNPSSGSTTFAGVIAGTNGGAQGDIALLKSGNGTLVLSGANTYTGGTTINAGTITAGSATALGPAASARLTFGSGSTGKFQLNGNNTTLIDLNTNATVGSPIIESGSGTAGTDVLTINTTNNDTFGGVLQNGSTRLLALTKSGNGTLTLTGTNTYTGTTTINGGTLVLGNATNTLADNNFIDIVAGTLSLGNNNDTVGNVVLETGSITGTGGTLTSTNYDFRSGTVSANLAGSGTTLTKSGSGGLSLTGTNTYDGGTTINGGDVTFNNSSALGTGVINFGPNDTVSMSLMSTTPVSLSNNIVVNDLDLVNNPGRTATLGSSSTASSGTNAYTGNILLNNDLNIKSSSPTSNPLTFSTGVISGAGGLVINPAGATTGAVKLDGNNTYAGNTSIAAGTLLATGGVVGSVTNSATGTGNVTVSGSGTMLAGGSTTGTTGSILGTVEIGSGSKLSPGTSGDGTANTAILHTGALTLSSGAFYTLNLNSATAGSGYDQVISSGSITFNSSTLQVTVGGTLSMNQKFFILENSSSSPNELLATFTNGVTVTSGAYTFLIDYADNGDAGSIANDISLTVTEVPEPGTWIGAALALVAVGLMSRKRYIKKTETLKA